MESWKANATAFIEHLGISWLTWQASTKMKQYYYNEELPISQSC